MSDAGPRQWLRERSPRAPASLERRVDGFLQEDGSVRFSAFMEGAESALERVLGDPSIRDRESAYDLLAADALLTYACETVLSEEDPASSLEEILRRVVQVREQER